MTDGIFETNAPYSHARAREGMSTQSETDFEWSVKIIGDDFFEVGIASQLSQDDEMICSYDENAILYSCYGGPPLIATGRDETHIELPEHRTGDVIRFRFEPQRKKLVIDLVRIF